MTTTKKRTCIKINALMFGQLVELMLDGVYSCQELADRTGAHYVTVLNYTRAMHRAGALHICAWEADTRGRHLIKIYRVGRGPDAKRPKRKTSAERQAAVRVKRKQREMLAALSGAAAQ